MKLLVIVLTLVFTAQTYAKIVNCSGTEPFWNATINTETGKVRIVSPDDLNGLSVNTKILATAGSTIDYAFVAQSKEILLTVTENKTCNDGMSDEIYNYSTILIGYGQSPFSGCCK